MPCTVFLAISPVPTESSHQPGPLPSFHGERTKATNIDTPKLDAPSFPQGSRVGLIHCGPLEVSQLSSHHDLKDCYQHFHPHSTEQGRETPISPEEKG